MIMKKNILKLGFGIFIGLLLMPTSAKALVFFNTYLISSADSMVSDAQAQTGSITMQGTVYPYGLQAGAAPNTPLYYRYQKYGGVAATDTPFFYIGANNTFSATIDGLECGSAYKFWLFESPGALIMVTTDPNSPGDNAMTATINCNPNQGGGQISSPNDVLAPGSAGATILAGVNWGTINVTDHSISISNAHIIPIDPTGPKNYKLEFGTGEPNQYNQPTGGQVLDTSDTLTLSPPYNFNLNLGGLTPSTSYFLNLWEVADDGTETNLLVYVFTETNQLTSNQSINYTFPSNSSVHVYGNLTPGVVQALAGSFVTVEIYADSNLTTVVDAAQIVPANSVLYGTGFYEHTFDGLTPNTVYYVVLRQGSNDFQLAGPVQFTMPDVVQTTTNTTVNITAPTTGIVSCNENCGFDDLIETLNRLIKFLIVYIGFPLVAVVAAWVGIRLLLSGGNQSAITFAKGAARRVILGLVIALLCWAIIKLILITLGYTPNGALWEILGTTPN